MADFCPRYYHHMGSIIDFSQKKLYSKKTHTSCLSWAKYLDLFLDQYPSPLNVRKTASLSAPSASLYTRSKAELQVNDVYHCHRIKKYVIIMLLADTVYHLNEGEGQMHIDPEQDLCWTPIALPPPSALTSSSALILCTTKRTAEGVKNGSPTCNGYTSVYR